ncbi:MAG: hypothetical protein QXV17_01280 [Candidatus Micrarchaeaceae archaeon]
MELLEKVVVYAVVTAVIIVGIYFAALRLGIGAQVSESQAKALVLSDLANTYPGAAINITNVTPSQFSGSWHIVASIVINATKPCPSFFIYSFDYPKYGFIYRVENNYTSNCIVYGLLQNKSYILASYPVAIARSYSMHIPSVDNFVGRFGFNNTVVHATYYPKLSLFGINYTRIWLVNYSSPKANYSEYVLISQQGGNLVANYTISH